MKLSEKKMFFIYAFFEALYILCLLVNADTTSYMRKVLSVRSSSLLQYLPMYDSGTVARDYSGHNLNGVYSNCTLNVSGFKSGEKAVGFDGVTSTMSYNAKNLSLLLNRDSGTVMIWVQSSATPWGGTAASNAGAVFFTFFSTGVNYIQLKVQAGSIYTSLNHAALHSKARSVSSVQRNSTDWIPVFISWSKAKNRIRSYLCGARYDVLSTYSTSMTAGVDTTYSTIGNQTGTEQHFKGRISNFAVWSVELSQDEIHYLADVRNTYSVCGVGDSYTSGSGASTQANRWINRFASKIDPCCIVNNAGISGTILQNSYQNTVDTIGKAAANNARDRFSMYVLYESDFYAILVGLNDMRLNDAQITYQNYQNDLNEIVSGLKAAGINQYKIIVGSIPCIPDTAYLMYSPWNGANITKHLLYNNAVISVCTSNKCVFADVYTAMKNAGMSNIISSDKIHPNDSGHAVIANCFYSSMGLNGSPVILSVDKKTLFENGNDTISIRGLRFGASYDDSTCFIYKQSKLSVVSVNDTLIKAVTTKKQRGSLVYLVVKNQYAVSSNKYPIEYKGTRLSIKKQPLNYMWKANKTSDTIRFSTIVDNPLSTVLHYHWYYYDSENKSWVSASSQDVSSVLFTIPTSQIGYRFKCRVVNNYNDTIWTKEAVINGSKYYVKVN